MTTSEVEALAKVYEAARADDGGGWPDSEAYQRHKIGLEAVARAVRAQDEARAGTLTAEALERCLDVMIDGDTDADACERAKVMVLDHSAAQGRANAALTRERDEALNLAKRHKDVRETFRKERDEARAELAKAEASERTLMASVLYTIGGTVEGAPTGPHNFLQRLRTLVASESALATLRQRLNASCPLCHGRGEYLPECELCSDSTHDHECPGWRKCEHKAHSLDATPAEHPDTATLRGIRERSKDEEALGAAAACLTTEGWSELSEADKRAARASGRAGAAYLLGDSGPSGGPGGPPLYRCSNCGVPRSEHPTKECTQWESSGSTVIGPSGGGETATPTDWSKHAKGCTVEWTPTPSGPTPRVWTCATDCPSKPTTPQDVAQREPDCAPCEGTGSASKDRSMYAASDCKPCAGSGVSPDVAASEPTPEEDWRTVELLVKSEWRESTAWRAAIARLKAEPRRAAEAMRERCAKMVRNVGFKNLASVIMYASID